MLEGSMVVQSLKSIRDRFFDTRRTNEKNVDIAADSLESLPVELQFLIMTFLSPPNLCKLGSTSTYWRSVVRDPVLWKYFLLRDLPLWHSVDHLSLPRAEITDTSVLYDSKKELDYMAEYLRVCPASRHRWHNQHSAGLESFRSIFCSAGNVPELRFAMFGPGLEQLDLCLMNKIMCSPGPLPVTTSSHFSSGISFKHRGEHDFNIQTLYSNVRADRERARLENLTLRSKLFLYQQDSDSNIPLAVDPHIKLTLQSVKGFIYVANAEIEGSSFRVWEEERAQIRLALEPEANVTPPLLVLSCVCNTNTRRVSCMTVAHQLQLSSLPNPWMVQDTTVETLSGLLHGIDWLLEHCGVRI